jgi:mannose-6-phosphate isomerase-like protein (cupin superfamily)
MNRFKDTGPCPTVLNIQHATLRNTNYRTTLWTGEHLQLTVMCIPVCGDIGLEIHPDTDQFIRIEQGRGMVSMGRTREVSDFTANVGPGCVVFVPAGTWHNLVNTGRMPLKLYTI